jgi:2-hydroxychromene-2-carboxylate isomerase
MKKEGTSQLGEILPAQEYPMEALKINKVVERDGEITITGLPVKQGQKVEMILLTNSRMETTSHSCLTAKRLLHSGLVGMWKDREDVDTSATYARRLREDSQNRFGER